MEGKKLQCPSIQEKITYCVKKNNAFLAHLSWRLKWAFLIKICLFSFIVVLIIVVVIVVNISNFHLVLQNHLANFNQTWHKASLGEVDLNFFKWRATSFSKGR